MMLVELVFLLRMFLELVSLSLVGVFVSDKENNFDIPSWTKHHFDWLPDVLTVYLAFFLGHAPKAMLL